MRAWQSGGKKVDLKIKVTRLLGYVKLSGMTGVGTMRAVDIIFSP